MIKVNLIVGKKPFVMPVILGFDTAKFKWKFLAVAIALSYVPDFTVKGQWEESIRLAEEENQNLQQEAGKLQKKAGSSKSIQDMINALAEQEKRLADRLAVVKTIFKMKKNPMQLMLYVSKNIPEDLWITEIEINSDTVSIKGESKSYKSIGVFIENLKNSVFFNSNLELKQSQTTTDKDTGKRKEMFEISGTLKKLS